MACPDRNKDAHIITEIERRKAIKEGKTVVEQSPSMHIVWEGNLWELQFTGIDQIQIISIEQAEPGVWIAHYKE